LTITCSTASGTESRTLLRLGTESTEWRRLAPTGTRLAEQCRAIAGAIANHRHGLRAKRRRHHFTDFAIGNGPTVVVKYFKVELFFMYVAALPGFTLAK